MLPDFPELKAELDRFVSAKLRAKIASRDSVVSQIRSFTQHEGTNQRYKQLGPEGKTVEEGFQLMSTEFFTATDEIPTLMGANLEKKLDEIADKAGAQLARAFYEKLDQSCEQAGTSVDAGGRPVSAELLLEMMNTVQVEFDSTGKPTTAIVIHPDMTQSFLKVAEQIENDPELKRRSTEILDRQREAWAARESNRKLVD